MVNITNLEKDVIENGFGKNNFNTDGDQVWSWSLVEGCKICTEKQISGVVGSLVKKGLAQVDGEGKEKTVNLTAAGKELLKEYTAMVEEVNPISEAIQEAQIEATPKEPELVVIETPNTDVGAKKLRNIDVARRVLEEAGKSISINDAVKRFLEIHTMKSSNPERQARIVFLTAAEHGVPVVMSEDKKSIVLA